MIIEPQILLYEGLPGAGKSFHLVREMLEQMLATQCRVFTNLPLRQAVVRQWLRNRGGEAFANLLNPLEDFQFAAFLRRSHERRQFRKRYRANKRAQKVSFNERQFERDWLAHAGPDVCEGEHFNWIPPFSIIIVDEVQDWFSSRDNQTKVESPDLMSYLTMHRHYMHRVYFATQDRANISINIRRLTRRFVQIRRRGNDKLVWGICWKHIGLNPMAAVEYDAAHLTSNNPDLGQPISDLTVYPSWPKYRWIFRMYDSFTHVGGIRRLEAVAARARKETGVEGLQLASFSEQQEMAKRKYRWWSALAAGLIVGLIGGGVAGVLGGPSESVPAPVAAATAPPADPVVTLKSVSKSGVVVGRKFVKIGGNVEGLELVSILGGNAALFQRGERVYIARAGETARFIGSADELHRRVRDRVLARLAGGVGAGGEPGGSAADGVGNGEGVGVVR